MDAVTGAAIAGVAAAASIVAAAVVPLRGVSVPALRGAGAASIAATALVVLGVPLPALAPLEVLAVGLALAALWPRLRTRLRSQRSPAPERP